RIRAAGARDGRRRGRLRARLSRRAGPVAARDRGGVAPDPPRQHPQLHDPDVAPDARDDHARRSAAPGAAARGPGPLRAHHPPHPAPAATRATRIDELRDAIAAELEELKLIGSAEQVRLAKLVLSKLNDLTALAKRGRTNGDDDFDAARVALKDAKAEFRARVR